MEEKLKDVYENVKDRLSNPLIFSFITSWLICNWRISIALIRYDKSQFSGCGCQTIFDYIKFTYCKYGNTWLPIILAFVYTFGFPYLTQVIRIVKERAIKWGAKNETKYVSEGISKEHQELKNQLENLVSNMNQKENFINKLYNKDIISGSWTKKIKQKFPFENETTFEIRITGNDIYVNEGYNRERKQSEIKHFYYECNNNKIFFVSEKIDIRSAFNERSVSKMDYEITSLHFKENGNMFGTENENDVEYIKNTLTTPNQ